MYERIVYMKKIIALLAAFLIVFTLFTACSKKAADENTDGSQSSGQGDAQTTPDDKNTAPASPSNTGGTGTGSSAGGSSGTGSAGSGTGASSGSSDQVGKTSSSDIIHQLPASPDVVKP